MGQFTDHLTDGNEALHAPNVRDQVAHLVGKAISTGAKRGDLRSTYISGRKAAFVTAAADLMSMNFGTDPIAAKRRINLLVKDVRDGWTLEDLRDEAKVGTEAHIIVAQALND